jgi:putative redox protein
LEIRGCDVETHADRAETDPKVFTKINILFKVYGRNLRPNLVERAIDLSQKKYCSATKMLGLTADISHRFELIEDTATIEPAQ